MDFKSLFAVAMGGGLSTFLRFILMQFLPLELLFHFPLPIFMINTLGCFVLGGLTMIISFFEISSPKLKIFLISQGY